MVEGDPLRTRSVAGVPTSAQNRLPMGTEYTPIRDPSMTGSCKLNLMCIILVNNACELLVSCSKVLSTSTTTFLGDGVRIRFVV